MISLQVITTICYLSEHMHYFIDGYNFLFRSGKLGENLKKEREQMIHELSEYAESLGLDITLVFDSSFQGLGSKGHFHKIEIVFTAFGQEADTFILNELDSSKTLPQQIVVTSDKILSKQVNIRKVKTETVEDFLEWLKSRSKNKKKTVLEEKKTKKAISIHEPLTPVSKKGTQDSYLEIFEKKFAEEEKKESLKKALKKQSRKGY